MAETCLLATWYPALRRRHPGLGYFAERENLWEREGSHRGGYTRSSEEATVMVGERRGVDH